MISTYTLKEKTKLTHDVFKLHYTREDGEKTKPKHGQFITFLVPTIGGRAYSVLESDWVNYTLIIKRLENGRGGSKAICDMNVGETMKWVGPAWHFLLRGTEKNKLFIGTGTWFVPLYNQILWAIETNLNCKLHFIFWLREKKDVFYIDKLEALQNMHNNFTFDIYLSQDNENWYHHGRNTEYITEENIKHFEEFYICWAPAMMDEAISRLSNLAIIKEQIFTEKY